MQLLLLHRMLQLGFLKVLPGTQMNKETEMHGLRYMDEPPYEILATNYMPYEELQFLKRLESVFEQTYNTGYFGNVLRYLIEKNNAGAFAFYEKLTNWWVTAGHYPQTHNAKGVAKILYDFILENYANIGAIIKPAIPPKTIAMIEPPSISSLLFTILPIAFSIRLINMLISLSP